MNGVVVSVQPGVSTYSKVVLQMLMESHFSDIMHRLNVNLYRPEDTMSKCLELYSDGFNV